MLTQEKIMNALKHVEDPELHKSIVELNMVRNIQMNGTEVKLEVVLTIQGCPLKSKIQQDIEESLHAIGASKVAVTFSSMTKEERAVLTEKLKKNTRTETGMPSMLRPDSGVQFLTVTSGKGGVGKSTVTINLATALARMGKKVGILDADIYGFSIPAMMETNQKPTMIDQTAIPVISHGVKIMSMGFFTEGNNPVMWRGPMLNKWIQNFLANTHWGELDYLLLDLPPGTGDVAIDVAAMIPQAKEIIVTTPHNVASFVASRVGVMAKHTKHEILGIVENMAYYEEQDGSKNYLFGKGGGEMLAEQLQTEVIAQVPFAKREENSGSSVYDEDSLVGEVFTSLAEDIIYKG
ncbi:MULTISPECIES: P-loop NTPase [Bacillus cereus group]|uniref:P-loop NTPase n=1 Tax=Bacillus cereus group TaxID=86661 RepID=UPI00077875A8|nr:MULTISPECIES: P-loop NTPase [Bacillus cereus group]KXY06454.1 ATP-binding protein [Bacillus cereus]MCC2440333.1 Mrp/NBP35 family ATP-binding protein [Bacillus paranthracis]MCM0005040.1 Mrp/NBP35 family ATP-binding protein [Bacillus paranthracis]MDA1956003.1 P-loop NTPase [Bacillus cereus group sp. BcHK114]MEC4617807.1 P-loop NTPase [Bacillus paranthracis]